MDFAPCNGRAAGRRPRLFSFLLSIPLLLSLVTTAFAQDCSATSYCETGCCSKWGNCGVGDEFCGDGCLSTCDYKLGCDKDNPCADGTCCSSHGFCGLGPDFCSAENCVSGCDAKSFCDPGDYGPDHAENAKCPLNVCCSKRGYCGMTAEFCGEKKVKRPSCSGTGVKRVIGYFEGWAPTRRCQSFQPEDVPVGVYTHINFAFAVIDPVSYRIAPASASDVHLYKQVTDLKRRDKNLKVFIAIGGWSYNDPGPTRETFSRLAADPAKQKIFFQSLVSFMNTYNFDGVDIDWEYPGAKDRGGRDTDFENMPVFIGNMRKALESSGTGRTGVTMALPVAYWYLRHFDIKKVAPHVDFFNMMSYDLHGSWDKTIKWVGPYLNSHTNLTEITEYLDLLWRNDIPPAKVNMGLGFYTRHFTAESESCMSPGCRYESAGPRGPCTDEIGVLSNAEIMDLEARPGPPAALDPEAAVKVLKRGREWITYDDETTWKLKVARASELCFGGVMVWAISQDTAGGRFSRELQEATGYRSPGTSTFDLGDGDLLQAATQDTLIDQCRWSGCGKGCPSGYLVVPRRDGHHTDGVMRAPTGCSGGQTSIFCCPAKQVMPWCLWQDFNNGRCGSKQQSQCSQGYVEIGSHSMACRSNALWQVGCCMASDIEARTVSTKNYAACRWQGTPPRCGFDAETDGTSRACKNADNRQYLLHSKGGSGGAWCREGNGLDYDRAYCCDTDSEGVSAWGECVWRGGKRDSSGHCASDCPPDTVRVAFEPVAKCLTGGRSSCCNGISKTDRRRNVGDRWRSALEAAMNGQCKGVFSVFDKRDAPLTGSKSWPSSAVARQPQAPVKMLPRVGKRADKTTGGKAMKQLVFAIVHNPSRAGTILKDFPGTKRGCNYEWWGNDFGAEYRVDPDIEAAEGVQDEDIGWMPLPELPGLNAFNKVLDKRAGRDFKVHNRAGGGGTFIVTSAAYPNANKGNDLIAASGGLVQRYVIESMPTNRCGPEDYKLTIQGNLGASDYRGIPLESGHYSLSPTYSVEARNLGLLEKRTSVIGPVIDVPMQDILCPNAATGAESGNTPCAEIKGWEDSDMRDALRRRSSGDESTILEDYDLEGLSPGGVLVRRSTVYDRKTNFCGVKGGEVMFAPPYETSSTLNDRFPNVQTYGYINPNNCNDFDFGTIPLPSADDLSNKYATEHILELQLVGEFLTNQDQKLGRTVNNPDPKAKGKKTNLCTVLKSPWVSLSENDRPVLDGVKRDPIDHIMAVMPSNDNAFTGEFALLENGVNTAKMGMFSKDEINSNETMMGYVRADPHRAVKNMKNVISALKYMGDTTTRQAFIAQKKRIAARLKELDEEVMPKVQKTGSNGKWGTWQALGMEQAWNTFIKEATSRALSKAKDYNNHYIGVLKDGYVTKAQREAAKADTDDVRLLKVLIGKIDALDEEWERYKPLVWSNPF